MKKLLHTFGVTVVWTYFLSFGLIATPYYNWRYANEHGFWSWVLLGEVVATGKAAIWPYYLLTHNTFGYGPKLTRASPRTLPDFRDSIIAIQMGLSKQPESPIGEMPEELFGEIVYYHKVALEHAEKVDARDLQFLAPEAPKRFSEDYLAGLRLYCNGADSRDMEKMNRGALLINRWGNWYRSIQHYQ